MTRCRALLDRASKKNDLDGSIVPYARRRVAVSGARAMGERVVELVYISAARSPFAPAALRDLLRVARDNNRRLGVTGLLLHVDGSFLQVLEGPAPAVDRLYEKIARDPRHSRLLRMFRTERTERSFGAWSMGFMEADAVARRLPGFNDYLLGTRGTGLDALTTEKVRELAAQFRMGRWRQHVDSGSSSLPARGSGG